MSKVNDWRPLDGAADLVPSVLPSFWHVIDRVSDGVAYRSTAGMTVICSGSVERDGRRWLHVSVARPDRLPTWSELTEVKDLFIGARRKAIQVLPAVEEYINAHPNCLHLWSCLDEDGLPDFRKLGTL